MIAVDVVLLPPAEIMKKAIEVNSALVEKTGDTGIILDKGMLFEDVFYLIVSLFVEV